MVHVFIIDFWHAESVNIFYKYGTFELLLFFLLMPIIIFNLFELSLTSSFFGIYQSNYYSHPNDD